MKNCIVGMLLACLIDNIKGHEFTELAVYTQQDEDSQYLYAVPQLPDIQEFTFCMWLKWNDDEYKEDYLISIANSCKCVSIYAKWGLTNIASRATIH